MLNCSFHVYEHKVADAKNNPNTLQLKYSLRKMLLRNAVTASRNAVTASKNANCTEFTDLTTITSTVIPFFHKRTKPPYWTRMLRRRNMKNNPW
jgi:hypothetical protein